MEVRRRRFLLAIASTRVAAGAWLLSATERIGVTRALRALRAGRYPGPVEPLSAEDIRRPGRWLG